MLLLLLIKLYIICKENEHKFKAYIYLEHNCILRWYTRQEARVQRQREYHLELVKVIYDSNSIKLEKRVNNYINTIYSRNKIIV